MLGMLPQAIAFFSNQALVYGGMIDLVVMMCFVSDLVAWCCIVIVQLVVMMCYVSDLLP
jgi:hypothetical protein